MGKISKDFTTTTTSWRPLLVVTCFFTTLGSCIPVGYFLGIMNGPAMFIKVWCYDAIRSKYGLSLSVSQLDVLWALIVAIFLVGGICGSLVAAWCCNKFGRKSTLLLSKFLLMASGCVLILCRYMDSVSLLLLGRFIGGVAAALITTAHPMYLLEISPANRKGSVGVYTALGVAIGICVSEVIGLKQLFGNAELWHYALSFYMIFVLGSLPSYRWFVESPEWLLKHRQQDCLVARKALKDLYGSQSISVIYKEKPQVATSEPVGSKELSLLAVLRNSNFRLPLILVLTLQACQQLCGINAVFYYSVDIFTEAGFSVDNANWMNLACGLLNCAAAALTPFVINRFPRRSLLFSSLTGCLATSFGLAVGLKYIKFYNWLPALCIIFVALFIISFQLGLSPIPYFIGSELFEDSARPVAMSMGSFASWSCNFMIAMFFPLLENAWGSFAFLPCCTVCIYSLILSWRYLPETRPSNHENI
ncbi:solute carrier family 2, facilitated glucose transporter member 3-like isoform 1-T1 [Glossina fuscipes fuscipes]